MPVIGGQRVVMDEDVRVGSDENTGGSGAHFMDQSILRERGRD